MNYEVNKWVMRWFLKHTIKIALICQECNILYLVTLTRPNYDQSALKHAFIASQKAENMFSNIKESFFGFLTNNFKSDPSFTTVKSKYFINEQIKVN